MYALKSIYKIKLQRNHIYEFIYKTRYSPSVVKCGGFRCMLDVSIHRLTWRCGHGVVAIMNRLADVES